MPRTDLASSDDGDVDDVVVDDGLSSMGMAFLLLLEAALADGGGGVLAGGIDWTEDVARLGCTAGGAAAGTLFGPEPETRFGGILFNSTENRSSILNGFQFKTNTI